MKPDYPDIDIAPFIDHALLTPAVMPEQVEQWCEEADRFQLRRFAYILLTLQLNFSVVSNKICTVIGFPSGATTSAVLYEAGDAVENGATELDVVINLSWLKTGRLRNCTEKLPQFARRRGKQ